MERRVRDSSGKPTDQWSDNGIGRGLVTNSPVRLFGEHAQSIFILGNCISRTFPQGFF